MIEVVMRMMKVVELAMEYIYSIVENVAKHLPSPAAIYRLRENLREFHWLTLFVVSVIVAYIILDLVSVFRGNISALAMVIYEFLLLAAVAGMVEGVMSRLEESPPRIHHP